MGKTGILMCDCLPVGGPSILPQFLLLSAYSAHLARQLNLALAVYLHHCTPCLLGELVPLPGIFKKPLEINAISQHLLIAVIL